MFFIWVWDLTLVTGILLSFHFAPFCALYYCFVYLYIDVLSCHSLRPHNPQSMLTLKIFSCKHTVLVYSSCFLSHFFSWVWSGLYDTPILLILLSLIMCLCFGALVNTGVLGMCVRERFHTSKGYLIPFDYLLLKVLYKACWWHIGPKHVA
jgi:hypothetical protein